MTRERTIREWGQVRKGERERERAGRREMVTAAQKQEVDGEQRVFHFMEIEEH